MATWYVDSAAAGANDGTSPTDAWQTLAAINWALIGGGDTVTISGSFAEQLHIAPTLSVPSRTSRLAVTATGAVFDPGSGAVSACRISAPYVTLLDGRYTNAGTSSQGAGINAVNQEGLIIRFTQCDSNKTEGMLLLSCRDSIVEYNHVFDNGIAGTVGRGLVSSIDPSNPGNQTGTRVRYNTCYGNVRSGLKVGGGNTSKATAGDNICEYNVVYDNGEGLRCESAEGLIVRHNTIFGNTVPDVTASGVALAIDSCSDVDVYKNIILDSLGGLINLSTDNFDCSDITIRSNLLYHDGSGAGNLRGVSSAGFERIMFYSNISVLDTSATNDRHITLSGAAGGDRSIYANNIFIGGADGYRSLSTGGPDTSLVANNIFVGMTQAISEEPNSHQLDIRSNNYYNIGNANIITTGGQNYTAATLANIDQQSRQLDPEFAGPTDGNVETRDYTPTSTALASVAGYNWRGQEAIFDYDLLLYSNPMPIGPVTFNAGLQSTSTSRGIIGSMIGSI